MDILDVPGIIVPDKRKTGPDLSYTCKKGNSVSQLYESKSVEPSEIIGIPECRYFLEVFLLRT